ncbi:hypothetical protein [Pseudonocardia sp. ICBG1293]|uniref:hypothetical protein n=1 Tax=Pseudonocardia sp. ICBG1293 TaxID=2844382 RepID=UPI001CCCE399|nr:hypothetical protein [Pseudonocardia sp. ICBG1293]
MYLSTEQARALELLDSRDTAVDQLRAPVARLLRDRGLIEADGAVTAAGAAVVEEIYAERFAEGVAEMEARIRHREAGRPDG